MNLRDTIVQAIKDEADYFSGTGNPQHELASQVLERLASRIAAGVLTEDESSVAVQPGGTLVLRLDPSIGPEVHRAYAAALMEDISNIDNPGFKVLVVVANQLGSCENEHRP